jgi:transcription antitermination factor NusG
MSPLQKSSSSKNLSAGSKVKTPPPKWVIVQLTPTGEREKRIPLIVKSVHQILKKKLDVFVPAISQTVRDDSQTMFFMDGYIFIKYEENVPYLRLQDTMYFNSVLCTGGGRNPQYSLLQDFQLEPLRKGMNDLKQVSFKVGQKIKVIEGNYKNLIGRVSLVFEDKKHVQIAIDLASKKLLMEFPTTYLTKVHE